MTRSAPRITRDNWRTHPHSVWAFQNIRRLLPTRLVETAGSPRRLEEAAVDLDRLVFADAKGVNTSWSEFLARTHTDAMLVLHRGLIVYETYRNGMEPERPHLLFSITKSVIGIVAELLALAGKLDLDSRAADYVPELGETGFGAARLRDLLDMRDGVPFDETYDRADADIHRYSQHYWGEGARGVQTGLLRFGRDPATLGRFAYRTPVTDVVAWALREATGETLADLVSRLIWSRIGAEQHAFFLLDGDGHEIGGAGLNATLRDVARFALALRDRSFIPATLVDRLLEGGDASAFAACGRHPTRPGWSYRSFWWVRHRPRPALSALGVFGQRLFYEPASDLIVIRFGSHPVASSAATDPTHERAFAALAMRLNKETNR